MLKTVVALFFVYDVLHTQLVAYFLLSITLMMIYAILYMKNSQIQRKEAMHFDTMPEMSNKTPLLGHVLNFKNNTERFLDMFQEETLQHPTYSFSFPFTPTCFHTSDPAVNQHVLSTAFKEGIYKKPECGKRILRDLLGGGIFLTDGKEWQHHRGVISPLFHKNQLLAYIPLFIRNASKLISVINEKIAQNPDQPIDIQHYYFRYTLDTFAEIAFGVQLNSMNTCEETEKFFEAFEYVSNHGEKRMKTGELWRIKEFFFRDHKFQESVKEINDFVYGIIKERKAEPYESLEQKTDLLSMLIVREQNITDKELRDWVTNLVIAGRDTTAITLTWSTFELFQEKNKEIFQGVISEICRELDIHESDFNSKVFNEEFMLNRLTYDFQKKQRYLHKVFQETLRLYPPVPVNAFEATCDNVVKTSDDKRYLIKKGSVCIYSAWSTQRHPLNFENPMQFNPNRFDEKDIRPYSFLSFNAGPRICVGQEMAYIEAKILLTCMLSNFTFEIVNPENVRPKHSIILTVVDGLQVKVTPR